MWYLLWYEEYFVKRNLSRKNVHMNTLWVSKHFELIMVEPDDFQEKSRKLNTT